MAVAIVIGASILISLIVIITTRTPVKNYIDINGPVYTGTYAEEPADFSGELKVVSWNLNFANRAALAITELSTVAELRDADIILLQEIDEVSVEEVAQALRYNYIYYPASIHRQHARKFGNAILSRWPLSEPQKVILSDHFRGLKHNRIAVRAQVTLGDQQVVAYSTHLDMVWMLPGRSESQVEFLVRQVGKEERAVIVGGDFNSWTQGSVDFLDDLFGEIGVRRVSKEAGPTYKTFAGLQLTLDHIFASELFSSKAGAWRQTNASDHSPVWVLLSFEKTE